VAARFLDGVNASSVGVMAWTLATLSRAAITDLATGAVALAAALALWRGWLSSAIVILAAGAFGALSLLWAS
jgi:chromate transporter